MTGEHFHSINCPRVKYLMVCSHQSGQWNKYIRSLTNESVYLEDIAGRVRSLLTTVNMKVSINGTLPVNTRAGVVWDVKHARLTNESDSSKSDDFEDMCIYTRGGILNTQGGYDFVQVVSESLRNIPGRTLIVAPKYMHDDWNGAMIEHDYANHNLFEMVQHLNLVENPGILNNFDRVVLHIMGIGRFYDSICAVFQGYTEKLSILVVSDGCERDVKFVSKPNGLRWGGIKGACANVFNAVTVQLRTQTYDSGNILHIKTHIPLSTFEARMLQMEHMIRGNQVQRMCTVSDENYVEHIKRLGNHDMYPGDAFFEFTPVPQIETVDEEALALEIEAAQKLADTLDIESSSPSEATMVVGMGEAARHLVSELRSIQTGATFLRNKLVALNENEDEVDTCALVCESRAQVITSCGHVFCQDCARGLMFVNSQTEKNCPICRRRINADNMFSLEPPTPVKRSKIERLILDIDEGDDSRWLVVVNSTAMVKYVREHLKRACIVSCSVSDRFGVNGGGSRITQKVRYTKDPCVVVVTPRSINRGVRLPKFDKVVLFTPLMSKSEEIQVVEFAGGWARNNDVSVYHYISTSNAVELEVRT